MALGNQTTPSLPSREHPHHILWAGMLSLCDIAIVAVVRRLVALAHPAHNVPSQVAALDSTFAQRHVLTLTHILPTSVFVLLVPLQFSASIRARQPRVHRWIGSTLMTLAAVIGLSALLLLRHSIGGMTEVSAILFVDGLILFAMARAFLNSRRGQLALHLYGMNLILDSGSKGCFHEGYARFAALSLPSSLYLGTSRRRAFLPGLFGESHGPSPTAVGSGFGLLVLVKT
jgi:uncharacterized membrane protein